MIDTLKIFLHFFREQSLLRRTILLAGTLLTSAGAFFIILFGMVWSGLLGHLPDTHELQLIENPSATEVYSADSILLGRYFLQERSNITYDQLPPHVINAVLATEDIRFYNHQGIDLIGLFRVMVKTMLLQQEGSGGGSTITQQLSKNLFPRKKYTFFSTYINKLREMIIASRLETGYDKGTILLLYLNTVPFGENVYGLEAGAQLYYSCHAKDLTLQQGATLIGMLKANHAYSPRLYPERSRERRNIVMSQMVKYGMLDASTFDSLKGLPLDIVYHKTTHHAGLAPYFREYLRPELIAWCEAYNEKYDTNISLYTAGLKIYTTLDSRLQRYAEESMTHQMTILQKLNLNQRGKSEPWTMYPSMIEQAVRQSPHYQLLKDGGMSHPDIMKIMEKPVVMNIFTWEGDQELMMSPVDSIKHYLKFLQAGVLAMDPENGAIRVWVGGINHQYFQFDHVKTSTKRQVGSTFKPIVYAAALENGERPCSFISAEKITYTNMEDWAPENSQENYNMKYSMPGALAYSVNTVSIRVLEKAGIDRTVQLAKALGISSELTPVPSLALGAANISMIEMVTAYTAFARDGSVAKPFYISSITDHSDHIMETFHTSQPVQAMTPETARMVLHMLRRAVNEGGTSGGLRTQFHLPNDIAGKTGTTQSHVDGWFIGVTPRLVMGAWVGADDPRMRSKSSVSGQGARAAMPMVADFLLRANRDKRLTRLTRAQFPELSPALAAKLDCAFSREDNNVFKKLFSRKNHEKKRNFKEPKKGILKQLFGKKKAAS